jgi:YidC/Oxa1 family membrane protein insertase
VSNQSANPVGPAFLIELPIRERVGNDFREQSAAAFEDGELEVTLLPGLGKAGFFGGLTGAKDGEVVELPGEIDWAGVQTPYFLSAIFPDQPTAASSRFVPVENGKLGTVQLFYAPVSLPPGQQASRVYRGYLGPKVPEILEAFAPTAVSSIDLGWSVIAPMTRAFSWALAVLYSFIPNYGWAIIVLTILVRLVMAPLTMKQMKSMERMRKIQPRVKEIQEKHKDDRQKQSEAMMALYRQEGVNPLGGCFPMLLQLPVFIGLFYALRSSIQLRHAPWIAWIDDLSAPDLLFTLPGVDFPVRVLPILMGASMYFQQKLTPMQMDPAQARMMLIMMPGMMLLISYTFPSGLVLYWMMSNVLAIAHQLWIGRHMDPAETKN